jgi:hypothetical protein
MSFVIDSSLLHLTIPTMWVVVALVAFGLYKAISLFRK